MPSMWFIGSQNQSSPLAEEEARTTVEPIRTDNAEAEAASAPEWNQRAADESPQLVGLSPRVKGAETIDTAKYAPWWAAAASEPHNIVIDRQVASSGTAAAREVAGQQGHGTMQYADSVEPVIRDGAKFGNDYFKVGATDIQSGAGPYMTPIEGDNWNQAVAQAVGTDGSRRAFQSSLYNTFMNG